MTDASGQRQRAEAVVDTVKKEMELLKVENTTLRQLVEALINTWVNGRKIHDGIPLTLRQQIDATLAAKDAGKEVPSA